MIRIFETRITNAIVTGHMVFDVHRQSTKRITLFGITIWKHNSDHNLDYEKASIESKSIGFIKPNKKEIYEKENEADK